MIVKSKVKGFICTTAHPKGCAKHVEEQVDYVKKMGAFDGPKRALIIGASTGFGLASRVAATFGAGADSIGVSYEKLPTEKKTATPGYYNTIAFDKLAQDEGHYSKSINGDAFSNEIKDATLELIKKELGKVDLIIYSIASPRRIDPTTGIIHSSVLKPTKEPYSNKTIDFITGEMSQVTINPATEEEIYNTVKVMGGEDWRLWMEALDNADLLEEGAITIAYSYIGPELTFPVYRDGSIGRAKEHLEATAHELTDSLKSKNIKAYVSVNKALVTQASSAIPVVPLYISILYKIMKEKCIHEGCIEQMYRMYKEKVYVPTVELDEKGRIRLDDWEMRQDVQVEVDKIWSIISKDNKDQHIDLDGYSKEFYKLFGFGIEGVDYDEDVEVG
ncbi:MAG: enoyl-[acyl-carrier-protein] reductase FabV [Firmicutes bacterium HGW-Firmicutes-1]|jgi:enoyl-[acyl-carrier protein] reductase/trans-2-enoyl-CoA reductase (NAD+)|nr:MAG: enoyl-[acyl-carrier-protein] reductase FabV [Firmicutes bacterium HGW-Firmicutes-1]